ncbi:hypothetical protein D9757_001303 [Collybiopsis confluens]|uniref:non-specific serine/threonine protein kinase n=1 Tax=Collybiopsis confluens TaxID=2823264 RepID=A0A8H5I160_9AGAR|nr:hypothetical protein D9757_001303 [Collybiopsis confluens]
MLGARTKQINSYGKRSQRVVSAFQSESATKSPSILDDLPPPKLAPVASRMKKRSENAVAPEPKQRPVLKKKQSPLAHPLRQRLMRVQAEKKSSDPKVAVEGTPSRKPLAMYPLNTPGSPAVPSILARKRNTRASASIRTPLLKPHSDVVEVDIIVLDQEGKTISRERRISKGKGSPGNSSFEKSESDVPAPRLKHLRKRANLTIISDDEESSAEEAEDPSSPAGTHPRFRARLLVKPQSRLMAHVLIPPPSPDLAEVILAPNLPQPPSPPPIPLIDHDLSYLARPRQLTPIRRRGQGLFRPPSPPSPLTDSDLDISIELPIDMSDAEAPLHPPPAMPEYLRPLLEECQQSTTGVHEFSAFIEAFTFDPVVRASSTSKGLRFEKVGEASYSEVFGIGDLVLKVIPLRDESGASLTASQRAHVIECTDLPAPTDAKDVLKEIIVTRAMGEVCDRFVKLVKSYIVRGRYPQTLLEQWDEYEKEHGSESVRPDSFSVSQAYAIIVLPNGGPDLETYTFSNTSKRWRQAASTFWQVTEALARAEQMVSFEHRDLHWGQILIKDLLGRNDLPMQQQNLNTPAKQHSSRAFMNDPSHGVHVTLIDLGLARMDAGDGNDGEVVHWTPIDEETCMGEGDYQFDIYRMMREQNENNWEPFAPSTNVMWLHYLLKKLLHSKGLRAPPPPRQGVRNPSSHFTERECYECFVDLEHWLSQYTAPLLAKTKKMKSKRKPAARKDIAGANKPPACAGEIIEYGAKKRWVKPLWNL